MYLRSAKMALQQQFDAACASLRGAELSDETKLKLYGLFKVATSAGPPVQKSVWDMGWFEAAREQHKFGAWEDAHERLRGDRDEAKRQYVALARQHAAR